MVSTPLARAAPPQTTRCDRELSGVCGRRELNVMFAARPEPSDRLHSPHAPDSLPALGSSACAPHFQGVGTNAGANALCRPQGEPDLMLPTGAGHGGRIASQVCEEWPPWLSTSSVAP